MSIIYLDNECIPSNTVCVVLGFGRTCKIDGISDVLAKIFEFSDNFDISWYIFHGYSIIIVAQM